MYAGFGEFIKKNKIVLGAFFLPMIIQIIVYIAMGYFPFGNKSILTWDMDWQYVNFLSWLTRTMKGNGADSLWYSFSASFGSSTMGFLGYYLLSPFNLLLLLFSTSDLPIGIHLITILKLSFCGLSMCVYLMKRYDRAEWLQVLFSVMYALMGYNIAQQQNIMWLDNVILLPVVALGVYRFVEKKTVYLMCIALTAAFMVNFYIGYMTAIFAGGYLCLEIILNNQGKKIKKQVVELGGGLGCIVLSAAMAAVVLLPVYADISGSRMQGSSVRETLRMLFSLDGRLWGMVNKFFIGAYTVNQLKSGLPNIYIGALGCICALWYFMDARNPLKDRIIYGAACGALICSMCSAGLNRIWHGFSETIGCPYRYSFILCFLLIGVAYRQFTSAFASANKGTVWWKWLLIGMLAVGLFYKAYLQYQADGSDYLNPYKIGISLVFFMAWLCLLVLDLNKNGRGYGIIAAVLLLSAELGVNMGMYLHEFTYHDIYEYRDYVEQVTSAIERTGILEENQLYRIENDIRYGNDTDYFNDSMLIGYPSLTWYSSTLPHSVSVYAHQFGLSAWAGDLHTAYIRENTDWKTLGELGVKYYITKEPPGDMEGVKIIEDSPFYVLENLNYQPVLRLQEPESGQVSWKVESGKMHATIKNNSLKEQALIVMIPWHSGWTARIDDKLHEIKQYDDFMMEVVIPAGEHTLELSFTPVYLGIGGAISVGGWIFLLTIFFMQKRRLNEKLQN